MLGKIAGLARALAILLSVVYAFVAIPGVDAGLVLVVLGLIAGVLYGDDTRGGLILTVLVLPAAAVALGHIPAIGTQLGAIASNLGLSAAGAVATSLACRLFGVVKGDLTGLGKSA
ncbi:MAG: hypothetical protein RLY97_769 [Pseudomonadota bacterium]|jgi:hypothetical protein